MHSKEWFAVDLYRGATTADAAAALKQHGSANQAGDHRFLHVEHRASVKAQLQDGSVVWVSSDGAVRPAASPSAPPTAERLTLRATPVTRRGLHRVKRIDTDCGCKKENCGELVLFSSAAFGEGTNHLGLWKDDRLEWQRALDRWSIDEALAVTEHGEACALFGRNTVTLPVLGLYGSGHAVVFDRARGQRSHELGL